MRKTFTLLFTIIGLSLCASAQYSLVINELDYDQFNPSRDSAEFIELYNNGTGPINLADFVVVGVNGANAGAAIYRTITLPTYQLNAGSHYVICGNGGFVPLCNQVENVFADMIQNGSPDAVAILHLPDSSVVDALSYEGTVPGYSDGNGVPTANSDTVFNSFLGLSRYPDGNDSNDDSTDFVLSCITPGIANSNSNIGCSAPNSVGNLTVNNSLAAFPNPVREVVTLVGLPTTTTDWQIRIIDITGKEVYDRAHRSQNHAIRMDLSELINGVYILDATNVESPEFKG
jgi:hypothetical protein